MSITGPAGRVGKIIGPAGPIGKARVWDDGRWKTVYTSIRSVTIEGVDSHLFYGGSWTTSTLSGNTSLVDTLRTSDVSFVVPVVCDKDLTLGLKTSIGAGTVLRIGTNYRPDDTDGVYTFTEAT